MGIPRFAAWPFAVLFCVSALTAAAAQAQSAPDKLVQARLATEKTGLQRGATTWFAIELSMQPGWHTYWRNPGDSGLATSVKWTLPDGVVAGPIVWPRPDRFMAQSIAGYGYKDRMALLVPIRMPAQFTPDKARIGAAVSWLACAETCIPGSKTLELSLPVRTQSAAPNPAEKKLFVQVRQRLPQAAPFQASFTLSNDQIRIAIPRNAVAESGKPVVQFYPFDGTIIDHSAPQPVYVDGERIDLMLLRSPISTGRLDRLDGLLIVQDSGAQPRAFELSVRPAATAGQRP